MSSGRVDDSSRFPRPAHRVGRCGTSSTRAQVMNLRSSRSGHAGRSSSVAQFVESLESRRLLSAGGGAGTWTLTLSDGGDTGGGVGIVYTPAPPGATPGATPVE